jgi:ribulose-phosphate 3-epimerase
MYEIIPSHGTFATEWGEIEKRIESVRPFAKTLHIDIVDGIFAPNKTFADPVPFAKYAKDFILEVHLMVDNPINHLQAWADAGFQRFIGQVEKMANQEEFVASAQLLGEVVLALDKQTPVDSLHVPFQDLDGLLVMTIQAGQSGQQFEEVLLEKVKALRSQTDLPIEVDGGMNDETILTAAAAGVNRFVVTSFLFDSETPEKQFQILQEKLKELERV